MHPLSNSKTILWSAAVVLSGLWLSACGPGTEHTPEAPAEAPAGAPAGTRFTASDLEQLRWLEGRWRGTGQGQEAFFEEYRFVGDTLIRMRSASDSTFADSTGGATVSWSDGRIEHRNGAMRWEAAALDSATVRFEPRAGAGSAFTWRYESADGWTAVLETPGGEQVYRMERIRR